MYRPMVIIVPTRRRPHNVAKVINAWKETKAFWEADLLFVYDNDDPDLDLYVNAILGSEAHGYCVPRWMPMVPKLNLVAKIQAKMPWREVIGFAGDDHLPRNVGWAVQYLEELRRMGTGIVYGNDLHQGENLPTEWAMTKDIINALDRMVPAPVSHLYCDNSILALGKGADCIKYLPVVIEHMHPLWRKGQWDQQYRDVNSKQQYAEDGAAFEKWSKTQIFEDIAKIQELKRSHETRSDPGTGLDVQAAP